MRGVNGEISSNVSETRFRSLVFRGEWYARLKAGFWAISALVLSLLFVSPVYAEGMNTVIYGPISYSFSGERYTEIGVAAYNKYDAALVALGYNPDGEAFTDDVKAYLSNESTGTAFYSFAQGFVHPPTDGYGLENPGFWSTAYSIYGTGHVWRSEFTAAQRISAVAAVGLVLAGDIPGSGGGSGGGSETFPDTIHVTMSDWIGPDSRKYYGSGNDAPALNLSMDIDVTAFQSKVSTPYSSYEYCYAYVYRNDRIYGTSSLPSVDLYFTNSEVTVSNYKIILTRPYAYCTSRSVTGQMVNGTNNSLVVSSTNSLNTFAGSGTNDIDADKAAWLVDVKNGTVVEPTPPPTNWPTEPTPEPPTQPTVPDPPTGGTPPITNPVTYPTDNTVVNNTYTVDIQGILDAMAEHCQHIRDSIYQNCKRVYDGITGYMEDLASWWGTLYQSTMLDVCDYLQELFEWLADQFDYSVSGTGYDDNTVVSWLRKIYSKLGGGINTRPVDPVVDPPGFGDWFNQLLQNLVLDLLAIGQDVLADLVESFRELITKFPFCIPWDIAAMLALLVAEPEAPNVDWPVYTLSINGGLTQVATYEIDLSEYDSVMGGIRAMETFLFAGWLAFKTDFFKSMVSGFGGAK